MSSANQSTNQVNIHVHAVTKVSHRICKVRDSNMDSPNLRHSWLPDLCTAIAILYENVQSPDGTRRCEYLMRLAKHISEYELPPQIKVNTVVSAMLKEALIATCIDREGLLDLMQGTILLPVEETLGIYITIIGLTPTESLYPRMRHMPREVLFDLQVDRLPKLSPSVSIVAATDMILTIREMDTYPWDNERKTEFIQDTRKVLSTAEGVMCSEHCCSDLLYEIWCTQKWINDITAKQEAADTVPREYGYSDR